MDLTSIRISTPDQVEKMRIIYNDNLDMLSTSEIPYREFQEQQDWWKENSSILDAYLYEITDNPGEAIAFLVLTNRGRFYTPIIAISKKFWGKGYGKLIINDYIDKANAPLAGSQLKSNEAICHLNSKVGWQIIGQAEQPAGLIDLLYHPGVNADTSKDISIKNEIIEFLNKKYN